MIVPYLKNNSTKITEIKENDTFRVIWNSRPNGFVNGAIYTVDEISKSGDTTKVRLKGYNLFHNLTNLSFYKIEL